MKYVNGAVIAVGALFLILFARWIMKTYLEPRSYAPSNNNQVPLPDPAFSGEGTIDVSNALPPAAVANVSVRAPYQTSSTRPLTSGVVASRDAIAVESTGITPESVVGIPERKINQVVGPNVIAGNPF